MIELPQGHFRTNVFAHSDQGNCDNGKSLEGIVLWLHFLLGLLRLLVCLLVLLLLFFGWYNVLVAVVQHPLNLQHVACARKRACFDDNLGSLRQGVFDGL